MPRAPKRRSIRLWWEGHVGNHVDVCPHVQLPLAEDVSNDRDELRSCEYKTLLRIACKVCARSYDLTVLIG